MVLSVQPVLPVILHLRDIDSIILARVAMDFMILELVFVRLAITPVKAQLVPQYPA